MNASFPLGEGDGFRGAQTAAAWLLAVVWVLPLLFAIWTAFHFAEFSTRLVLDSLDGQENSRQRLSEPLADARISGYQEP